MKLIPLPNGSFRAPYDRWDGAKFTASDRRMLTAEWAGKGYTVFCSPVRQRARFRYFQRTGALMTTTGQYDDQISIAGVPDYTFARLPVDMATRSEEENLTHVQGTARLILPLRCLF